MARADLVRHQLFIPRDVSERRDGPARGLGASKSRILAAALAAFIDRTGVDELERRFTGRLERLSNQLARIECNGRIELDSLALFMRYMLTVNPPLPEGDKAARASGRDRFEAFVERVGQQLATGPLSLAPDDGQ